MYKLMIPIKLGVTKQLVSKVQKQEVLCSFIFGDTLLKNTILVMKYKYDSQV
jgi:hypothetical protein